MAGRVLSSPRGRAVGQGCCEPSLTPPTPSWALGKERGGEPCAMHLPPLPLIPATVQAQKLCLPTGQLWWDSELGPLEPRTQPNPRSRLPPRTAQEPSTS